ncbi:hypothetical protein [Methylomonas sp. ZR1]|uniref:hypothetical protein n=1 Tax=Methylomonas sp. ZR1 TaxID=1797072 RepID=UPI0014922936|nr:hypothetical protein [Methylomonas sp. ZR1]NOV29173.1 hypothetical protein [Methylomonas sp. ZR1]
MTDYPALYRQLAREVLKLEGEIQGDTLKFIEALVKQLRKTGYVLTPETEDVMSKYIDAMKAAIGLGISKAAATATQQPMQSEAVLKLAEQSFKQQWPDGLTLSDRLWKWDNATRDGVAQVLQDGIRAGKAVDSIAMDMQRTIERSAGDQRFKIVSEHIDDWVAELHSAALELIHDPAARADWNAAVENAREIIDGLKATGSRSAAERVLSEMQKAVEKGREELLDKAVKWWTYDKQLYNLKRIARTEMANAGHRAVIESSIDQPHIIGYQWRLSASHPVTDICDYYASIDMGLGKGVFTKDTVPKTKAHPHCMCLLIPRVSPVMERGDKNYADWLRNLSPEKQQDVLPDWAAKAIEKGLSVDKLIRPDGLGLLSQAEIENKAI